MKLKDTLGSWRWWLGIKPKILTLPPPPLTITVVIPAYNEEKSIEATIRSVQAQSWPIKGIIVVDDCSSDKTGDIARSLGVRVLRTPENQGSKARAQNYAIKYVETDLFATIDADTLLDPDAIEQTIHVFNDQNICAVSGTVIPQFVESFWERARMMEYFYGFFVFKKAQNHIRAILVASGCFTVFRTEIVKKFGGFKERTITEDLDLTWELVAAGYGVYYESKAICYPIEPKTRIVFLKQIDRWYRGLMQNVKVRHFNLFTVKAKMALLVYLYLSMFILGPIGIPLTLWSLWLYFENVTGFFLWGIGSIAISQAILSWTPALIFAHNHKKFWKGVGSIPAFFCSYYVNTYAVYRAIWKEWIVRDQLAVWHKGH